MKDATPREVPSKESRRPTIALVPMSAEEQQRFLEGKAVTYAEEKSRAGIWMPAEALDRSRAEIRSLVGEEPEAKGHRFFKGMDPAGRRVGSIWVGPPPGRAGDERARWLFDIVVEEDLRGRGYGKALLRATEDLLRWEGREELALNVFAYNEIAISLYTSSGYEVFARYRSGQEMRKRLGPA